MEVDLMVTKRDDDDDDRQGENRAICLWKMDWQSFAIYFGKNAMLKIVFNHLSLVVFYSGNGERCRYSRSQSGLQRAGQENG